MNWSGALWLTLGIAALIQVLTMRLTIRLVGRGAENAWDNAIAYVLVTGAALYWPCRWMFESDSFLLTLLAPGLCALVQVAALRTLYQVRTLHAGLIGVLHTTMSSAITAGTAFTAGVVAAYGLYGKIISDPVAALKILLRLIGIELPFA